MKTGSECIDACLAKKKTDDSINGVSIYADNRPGCWCEQNMNAIADNSFYKSCFIIDTGRIFILHAFFLKAVLSSESLTIISLKN